MINSLGLRSSQIYLFLPFLVVFLVCMFVAPVVYSQEQEYTVQIEFSFDTGSVPDQEVIGYLIYIDGEPRCQSYVVNSQVIDCSFVAEPGRYEFTMSALYGRGGESTRSAAYTFEVGDAIATRPGGDGSDVIIFEPGDDSSGSIDDPIRDPGRVVDVQPGDINGDGVVDMKDILTGLQALSQSGSQYVAVKADVNEDNKIGMEEVLYVFKRISR